MSSQTLRKKLTVFVGMNFLLTCFSAIAGDVSAFQSTKPLARVEYWQQRQNQIEQVLLDRPTLSKVKLLFLGDSITDFWQMGEDPWVKKQWHGGKIWSESFTGARAENSSLNFGISGDRTEHILYRIQPKKEGGLGELDSQDLHPEYVIIMLGINNSWAPEDPAADSIFQGVRAVVQAVMERKPKANIILESILPTNDPDKNANVVKPVNKRLKGLAESAEFSGKIAYLDLYPAFTDKAGRQIANYFVKDGLHPNENGYRVWRDQLIPFLAADRKRRSSKAH